MNLKTRLRLLLSTKSILLSKYKFGFPSANKEKAIFSFTADGIAKQGGLVDRLKGIISGYYLVRDRPEIDFKINFTNPFLLHDFLVPNKVDWIFKEEVSYKYPTHRPIYFVDYFNTLALEKKIKDIKAGKRVDFYYNIDILTKKENHSELWYTLFWELFKISPRLEKELAQFVIPKDAIAIHIRFLNKFGDFSDYLPESSSFVKNVLEEDKKVALRLKFEEALIRIINDSYHKKMVLFCDSNYFMAHLSEELKRLVTIIPGEIKQSEDKTQTGFDAHKKTFIDFFLMGKCDKVIMLKSKETYNSSFSKHAALVGGKPFDTINL